MLNPGPHPISNGLLCLALRGLPRVLLRKEAEWGRAGRRKGQGCGAAAFAGRSAARRKIVVRDTKQRRGGASRRALRLCLALSPRATKGGSVGSSRTAAERQPRSGSARAVFLALPPRPSPAPLAVHFYFTACVCVCVATARHTVGGSAGPRNGSDRGALWRYGGRARKLRRRGLAADVRPHSRAKSGASFSGSRQLGAPAGWLWRTHL